MRKTVLVFCVALLAPVAAQPLGPSTSLSAERLAQIQAGFPDKTIRDPFVVGARRHVLVPVPPAVAATPAVTVPPAPAVSVPPAPAPAPALRVTGIVTSRSGNQAIVCGEKQTRMVRAGDRWGELRVAAVEPGAVTFTRDGNSYRIALAH